MNWKITVLIVLGVVVLAALVAFNPMRTMTIKVDLPPTEAQPTAHAAPRPAP